MGAEDFKIGGLPTVTSYDDGNANYDITEQKITYTDKQQNLFGVDFKDVSADKKSPYHLAELPGQIGREYLFIVLDKYDPNPGINKFSSDETMLARYNVDRHNFHVII